MAILPIVIYRFNATLIKIPVIFFTEMVNQLIEFIWSYKGSQIGKTILKNNKTEGLTLLNFKTCYKAIAIKTIDIRIDI